MCTTTPSSRLTLPAELASGRLARRFIDEHWCASHDSAKQDHVLVLITELVSNAVRHGGPPITMSIDCVGARGVKLSVSDGSEKLPTSRDVAPNADGGRGVQLVDLLSSEWGVDQHHAVGDAGPGSATTGKTVWCLLLV